MTSGIEPVITVPIILYTDDLSGNKSKKWHECNNWCMMIAGLPRHMNNQLSNIHLLTFSDAVSVLDMAKPIYNELCQLEKQGVCVYDAALERQVLVFAPVLFAICDNPRASELLNHRGSAARRFCRICMVIIVSFVICYNNYVILLFDRWTKRITQLWWIIYEQRLYQ